MTLANALYVQDPLVLTGKSGDTVVRSLGPSAYNVILLAFLHPHSPWDLYFSDTQVYREVDGHLAAVDPALIAEMAARIKQLRDGFRPLKNVLLSIGPFQSDFDNVLGDVPAFVDNLFTVATQLGIDGYDFDYEGEHDTQHQDFLALLAQLYTERAAKGKGQKPAITAAPYYDCTWWAGVLDRARHGSGNYFSWFNVQFYAGPINVTPEDGPERFAGWRAAIAGADAGIADPSNFIVLGINADPGTSPLYDPALFTVLVENVHAKFPTMGGGFVWNYGDVAADVPAWSKAVPAGVEAPVGARKG